MSTTAIDRQVKPIYDSLDNGSPETAITSCNKLLKKHPKNNLIKALKALALVRLQSLEESNILCDEVLAAKPTEEATLSAMQQVLQGLGRLDGESEEEEEEDSNSEAGDETFITARDTSEEEEDVESEGIPLDDVDESVDEDTVPRQKVEIDNKIALERIRETIQLDSSLSWTETLSVTYPETIDVDIDDDLNRELAFYKQALHSANTARSLASKHNFPFTRPSDYFAEMVKSDAHMERIRQRLLDERAGIKRGEEKRKEREGKKFGKQVQIEKLKEREKSKKNMEERLKGLKRKRKGALDNAQADDEGFDVVVEDAISDRPAKRGRGAAVAPGRSKLNRHSRDKKFGFGGAGRRSKQNTRASTDNFDAGPGRRGRGGARGGRGGSKRPGKDRRIAARSRS